MKAQRIDLLGLITGHYNYLYDLLPFHVDEMPLSKRINVILSASNLILHRTNVYHWPISIFFELTNFCNLRCPICATGNGIIKRKPECMKPELLESGLKQTNKHVLVASLWAWGESLLHPQIEEMMRVAYKNGIERGTHIVVSTNGQNLSDEKVLNAMLQYPPTYLICTVDGLTDESLGVYRVGAKLQPILDGVKYISQHRRGKYPILHMRTIVMKQNEKEIENINDFAKRNYFDNLSLRGLVKIVPNSKFDSLVPNNSEYKSYNYKEGEIVHRECKFCRDSLMIPVVLTNGDLVACCLDYDGQLCYGNLNDKSFKELWFSKHGNDIRKFPLKCANLKPCNTCPATDRIRPITNLEYRSL